MDCKNCELKQRQFYCENCLRSHLRDFRIQTQHFAVERDDVVARASKSLEPIANARITRANVASYQERVEEIKDGLARMRKENDRKREQLRALRENLATRRQTLSAAKLLPTASLDHLTTRATQDLSSLSATIARARSGLVQELVEVFNVVEVGGRPPIGGKAGTKGEWTIGDLVLPVPGDIRRYPPDHINAVITHTVHFLGLLTFYLGIKLPFETTWSGKRFAVGHPWIGAGKGGESGGWARWHTKHPLHLSASNVAPLSPSGSAPSSPSTVSDSYTEEGPSQSSFTTAFAMLLYNVCYLAHTQSVEVPLSQAGDVLSNLWAVCCSPDLGRKSHSTVPLLPPPTPPTFPLDFSQLLQATTANPASRARSKTSTTHRVRSSTRKQEKIPEEEEGWDILDDVGEGFA
ncbi:hypothetical protein PLICRDRAFT_38138 [Plicaturopsis crispa FD-325 SS-3]|nr:hypothetical protein PLICRDRAFT_38138 [Plicaturopsis crispa FD-325 SS-3]